MTRVPLSNRQALSSSRNHVQPSASLSTKGSVNRTFSCADDRRRRQEDADDQESLKKQGVLLFLKANDRLGCYYIRLAPGGKSSACKRGLTTWLPASLTNRCLLTGRLLARQDKANKLTSIVVVLVGAAFFVGFAGMITVTAPISLIELTRRGDGNVDAKVRQYALSVLPFRWMMVHDVQKASDRDVR